MATNNTDYVSLRRLLEYHKEVVQPAIEDAGTIQGIKIGNTPLTIDNKTITLPYVTASVDGVLKKTDYSAFIDMLDAAVTSAVFDDGNDVLEIVENELKIPVVGARIGPQYGVLSKDAYDIFNSSMRALVLVNADDAGTLTKPTFNSNTLRLTYATDSRDGIISAAFYTKIKEGLINAVSTETSYNTPTVSGSTVNGVITRTLYIPMASTEDVTAGLLSNAEYKEFKAVSKILGDELTPETETRFINTLYEVIDFLNEYEDSVNLMSLLNAKANLDEMNTFTNANTFQNVLNVNGSFYLNSPIVLGATSGYSFKNHNESKTLMLPFLDGTGTSDYLTVVRHYNTNNALTSTGILDECEPITAESFAGWLSSIA